MKRLTEMFGVTNLIVSQVPSYFSVQAFNLDEYKTTWFGSLMKCFVAEIRHRLYQAAGLGLIPAPLLALQRFLRPPDVGDIRISPIIFFSDVRHLARSPSPAFIEYCIAKGERAAWRKLTQLQARCAIEFTMQSLLLRTCLGKAEEPLGMHRRVVRMDAFWE